MREIISKVQTMRKEAGFEVTDTIRVSYAAEETVAAVFASYMEEIKKDVLATDITGDALNGYLKEWSINGHKVTLGVEKNA